MKQKISNLLSRLTDFPDYFSDMIEETPSLQKGAIPALIIIILFIIYPIGLKIMPTEYLSHIFGVVIGTIILILFGILGIITIIYREAPLFIIPIRGIAAILIGLFLALGSFATAIIVILANISH